MPSELELFVPKEWSKFLRDKVNEPVDPELFSEDELFTWLREIGLCHDRSYFKKMIMCIKPYNFMQCMAPTLVRNPLNDKLIKLWANFLLSLYISDDVLETFGRRERIKVCNALQLLEEEIGKQFPRFPSITEMKQFLFQKSVSEQYQPHVLYWTSFSNDVAKSLLEVECFQQEEVKDYWQRLNMTFAIYLESVELETTIPSARDLSRNIWKRIASTGAFMLAIFKEPMSGAIGRIPAHLPLLNEMIFMEGYISMVINDIYGYNTDTKSENVANVVKMVHNAKNLSGVSEAVTDCLKSLNAALKVMYKKIHQTKQENRDNQELCTMLDNFGRSAVGYYFIHETIPRYAGSPRRFSLVELEEVSLKQWAICNEDEMMEEVKLCLIDFCSTAKKVSDGIIEGAIRMQSGLLLE